MMSGLLAVPVTLGVLVVVVWCSAAVLWRAGQTPTGWVAAHPKIANFLWHTIPILVFFLGPLAGTVVLQTFVELPPPTDLTAAGLLGATAVLIGGYAIGGSVTWLALVGVCRRYVRRHPLSAEQVERLGAGQYFPPHLFLNRRQVEDVEARARARRLAEHELRERERRALDERMAAEAGERRVLARMKEIEEWREARRRDRGRRFGLRLS